MSNTIMILQQVLIMFLLAGIGCIMYKTGKISSEGSKSLANILLYLCLPCVIINGFLVEFSRERVIGLLISTGVALIVLVMSILISRLLCGKNAIDCFAGAFSNPGFFGVPLILATLSDSAVFYIAAFIAFLNLMQWIYGVSLLENSDENGILLKDNKSDRLQIGELLKKLGKAPFTIAIIIGLLFFLTRIQMPEIIGKCIGFIANMNTPLAMFTIGIYLAQTDIMKMIRKVSLYRVSMIRLVVIPIVTLLLLWFVPNNLMEMKTAILIASACPVGSNVAVYAQLHGRNYPYAVETVVISTIISIITIPVVISIAGMIWN